MSGVIQAQMGGISLPDVNYISLATSASALTNYTFSNVNIGTATATRFVVVCCFGWSGSGSARTVSSVTIGGTAAAAIINPSTQYAGAIYGLAVPSGSTANIVVTYSGAMSDAGIYVFAVNNLETASAIGVNNAASSSSSQSFSLATVPNGVVIAHTMGGPAASGFTSWSGLTQNQSGTIESEFISAASARATSTSLTVGVNYQTTGFTRLTAVCLR